ncbi:hypothetical protein I0P70_19830 [Pontibacter sp. FD36]|nr:hypothetical protein [Pontibacter sp. FD36]
MLEDIARYTVLGFGAFIIGAGFLMLLKPKRARLLLRKAGSTNIINYTELIGRMIPATALILYADYSKFPFAFQVAGWFMLFTSMVLLIVPRKMHHQFSSASATLIKPLYFQFISPLAFIIGGIIVYSVL